jgi:hypothetical protein
MALHRPGSLQRNVPDRGRNRKRNAVRSTRLRDRDRAARETGRRRRFCSGKCLSDSTAVRKCRWREARARDRTPHPDASRHLPTPRPGHAHWRVQARATSVRAPAPGEMLHVDLKKVGRISDGGGWAIQGRGTDEARASRQVANHRPGYVYIHAAVDDHSRRPTPKSTPTSEPPPLRGSGSGVCCSTASTALQPSSAA